jgi:hypothetical protein
MQRSDVLSVLGEAARQAQAFLTAGDVVAALQCILLSLLVIYEASNYDTRMRQLSRVFFHRADLLFPEDGPIWRVLEERSVSGYLHYFRITPDTLDIIMGLCNQDWVAWREGWTDQTRTARRAGRVNLLSARMTIALALAFMATTVAQKDYEMLFGVTHATLDRDVMEGLQRLVEALEAGGYSPVWPTFREQRRWADAMDEQWGEDVFSSRNFAFVDGLRLRIQEPNDFDEQTLWYNGFTKTVNCTNLIVWTIKGTVCYADINNFGRAHDVSSGRACRCETPERILTRFTLCRMHTQRCPGRARALPHAAFAQRSVDAARLLRAR